MDHATKKHPQLASLIRAPRTATHDEVPAPRGAIELVVWMLMAIIGVAALAFWDGQREENAAIANFADDQAWLAKTISRAFFADRPAPPSERALTPLRSLERPGEARILIRPFGSKDLVATDGHAIRIDSITSGFDRGVSSVTLSRGEAEALGLPARLAVAGLAIVGQGGTAPWQLAVVTTAQAERDRASRARTRLLLSVAVVGTIVLAFGGLALRRRTRELELRHALEISALEAERAEKLARADKLATLGTLAMGIAHEVSTPLGVIVALAEQIAANQREPSLQRSGEVIVQESARITTVVRGVLDLARGHVRPHETVRVEDVARDAIALVSHRFAKARVALDARLAAAGSVACDPHLLEQAIVNLLLNACEACAAGGHVEISVSGDRERVAFVVSDDGEGIRGDDTSLLIEPFFTTKPEGSGLGLTIANEIVKHHRGTLALRPRSDRRGTQAIVELPTASE